MKIVFALFVIVAIIGMAMAGVHHYKIHGNGHKAADSANHGGSIFDAAASVANGIGDGIKNFFG